MPATRLLLAPERIERARQIDHMETNEPPNVRLRLSNRPENVALVRAMLAGVGEAIQLDSALLDDVRTAVTEACNNVVLHAYEGGKGPLEVDVRGVEDALVVVVRDRGIGIGVDSTGGAAESDTAENCTLTPSEPDAGSLKLGLPMIRALAEVELERPAGGGTEVRMRFATPGSRPLEQPSDEDAATSAIELPAARRGELVAAATIAIAPERLARAVLPRLVCALAARANFSTDRLADAQLVADVIAAQAFESIVGSHLGLGIAVSPRRVELLVGPLPGGQASEAAADSVLGKLGQMVEKLIDNHSIAAIGSAAVLALQLIDRR